MKMFQVSVHILFISSLSWLIQVEGTCTYINPSDLVFVVDSSGSICDTDPGYVYLRDRTCNNWRSIISFMEGIVNELTIGPSAVMVGLVVFHSNAKVAWTLDQYQNKSSLLHAINNLAYVGGDTATTAGLRAMRTQVFSQVGDRPSATNIAIVITDGNPTIDVLGFSNEVAMVRAAGITVVAVGITNQINETVLQFITSPPQQLNVNYFMTPGFASMSSISKRLEIYTFCPSEAPILNDTTTGNPCTSTPLYSDITFVVDASGSICDTDPYFVFGRDMTCGNWQAIVTFMKSLVSDLEIGPTANRIAVVIFYSYAYVAWNLDTYSDKNSLINAIDQLRYDPGGDTATTDGLMRMRTEVFSKSGDRPNFYNMAIVITDGRPTIRVEGLQSEIDLAQSSGIVMFAIGITNSIDENTLKKLSSPPQKKDENYFMSPDFTSIATLKSNFQSQVLCPSATPPGPVIGTEPCIISTAIADITFVVDASGSICDSDPNFRYGRDITCSNWQQILDFLKNLVSGLNIGPNGNKVALVIFQTYARVAWTLDSYSDTVSLVSAIDRLQYEPGGDTATTDGLEKMRTEVFTRAGDRQGVTNMAIIITDGRPTIRINEMAGEIARVQEAGIIMAAIGITSSIDENTLKSLTSPPHQKDVNYFMSPDFSSINTIKKNLEVQVLCPNMTTRAPILKGTTTLKSVCNTVNKSDIVFVVDNSGSICDSDLNYRYPRDSTCTNWQAVLNFIRDLVSVMPVSSTEMRVGLVTFHSYATVLWTLDTHSSKYEVLNAIDNIRYVGGDTATTEGLMRMRTQVFSQFGDRADANNVAIVITDGRPTIGLSGLSSEVSMIQAAGIKVVAVGITSSIDENTLKMISSPPHQLNSNYFMSASFESVNLIRENLEKATFCPNQ